jgi:hypothetical protein
MSDDDAEGSAPRPPLTNEERLRALTGDRKRKAPRGSGKGPGDLGHRPGDVVDAVRERTNLDTGRDTPF